MSSSARVADTVAILVASKPGIGTSQPGVDVEAGFCRRGPVESVHQNLSSLNLVRVAARTARNRPAESLSAGEDRSWRHRHRIGRSVGLRSGSSARPSSIRCDISITHVNEDGGITTLPRLPVGRKSGQHGELHQGGQDSDCCPDGFLDSTRC